MKVLTISELLCLTKIELLELSSLITDQLPELPYGSVERDDSLATCESARESDPRTGVIGVEN